MLRHCIRPAVVWQQHDDGIINHARTVGQIPMNAPPDFRLFRKMPAQKRLHVRSDQPNDRDCCGAGGRQQHDLILLTFHASRFSTHVSSSVSFLM
jgi:hypothetical protein